MDKYKKFAELMAGINKQGQQPVKPLFNAVVISVQQESCTIDVDGLHLDEVRLKATINESENKIMIYPAVGSMVLVGSLTGDLKDLAVLAVDEIEKLEYAQNGLKFLIDSTDGKVSISNGSASVYTVFELLTTLLEKFQVFTPAGPSGQPLPTTITNINQFETEFKSILK